MICVHMGATELSRVKQKSRIRMAAAENIIVRSATLEDYRQILDLGLGAFGWSDTV